MAERRSQQKDRAVPQLSCALCRDRKLKCDKLDPCTNCTSSGVVCVPVYRPRLPRGRHARRARNNASPTAATGPPITPPCRHTSTGEHGTKELFAPGKGSDRGDRGVLGFRIDRLESLVQRGNCCNSNVDLENDGLRKLLLRRSIEDSDDAQLAATSLPSPTSWKPELSVGSDHDDGLCVQEASGLWANFIHRDRGIERAELPLFDEGTNQEIEMDEQRQDEHAKKAMFCLSLLGLNNPRITSATMFARDKEAIGNMCRVYLQNVDPIIKVLHRPSLRRWMLEGDRYLGYPEEHTSVMALESAVCYAAANTLTDSQCKAMFRMSKASIVSMHRKFCENAIERAGLLTTRDRIVLQAFVLYLIGRRSEEKGAAVWTLVALAVRLTMAMGLNREPNELAQSTESFFHRQMRLRLWLTICLLDLQASFAQSTKPLISHVDAEAAMSEVRHINDDDFEPYTMNEVTDREELTDTTFALVTYRAQVAGRLLNFAGSEPGIGTTSSCSTFCSAAFPSQEQRRHYVSQFQQQSLALVHFCDPESSPYAWFTWHSTQCLVSAMRLSELLPFQYTSSSQSLTTPPSPQPRADTDLLRRTLQNLEKTQLIYTDPRGEGFRWYITIPWLALSTAITECTSCADTALVRRAWPVIEASYLQYESFFIENNSETSRPPLALMMDQTREKLSPILQGTNLSRYIPCGNRARDAAAKLLTQVRSRKISQSSSATPIDPVLNADEVLMSGSTFGSEASHTMSTQFFSQHNWDPTSVSLEYTSGMNGCMATPNLYHTISSSEVFEPSWLTGDVMGVYSNIDEEDEASMPTNEGENRDVL
ncbi:hypothetical protein VB005_08842 [Metarhizium brunneum]